MKGRVKGDGVRGDSARLPAATVKPLSAPAYGVYALRH